jgi:hypothetical protein
MPIVRRQLRHPPPEGAAIAAHEGGNVLLVRFTPVGIPKLRTRLP